MSFICYKIIKYYFVLDIPDFNDTNYSSYLNKINSLSMTFNNILVYIIYRINASEYRSLKNNYEIILEPEIDGVLKKLGKFLNV